jgi:thiaminase/transcriptional activator TenA
MLHKELITIAEPVLDKVKAHPFWSGIRDGSLPVESLAYFVRQDSEHLLPGYASALARCAAVARVDGHAMLLAHSVIGSLEAKGRLRANFDELAEELGTEKLGDEPTPIGPSTHAQATFFTAASALSFASGVAALLPMVWFNFHVSNDLLDNQVPNGRYAAWIATYHPGQDYRFAVQAFLDLLDDVGAQASAAERELVFEQFATAVHYEWGFAEAAWQRSTWPV